MAVVEPGEVDAFLAICAKWDVEATVIGEVTDGDRLADRVARRDRRRCAAADRRARGPGLRAPVRPPGLAGRAAGRRADRAAAARRPATSCGRRCCGWSPRRTSPTSRGSPTSTTATCRATPCSPSRRTPAWSASTRRPASASRIATDGNGRFAQARPVRRRAARAGGGVPQRRRDRRPAARRHRLPELRLARGPGRDVAVRRGRAAGWPTAASSSASRSPAATSASTTRPATTAILPTPVVGVLGVIDDVARRTPMGFAADGRRGRPARRRPATSWRLGVGARRARPPRRPAAAVDLAAEQLLAEVLVDGARDQLLRGRPRPVRGRPRPGAGRDGAARGRSACTVAVAGDPFVALFSESTARAVVVVVPATSRLSSSLRSRAGVPVAKARRRRW